VPARFRSRDSDPQLPAAPFVVGVARSGTTLLRLMLDAHPELTIPPETHFLPKVVRAARDGAGPDAMIDVITGHRRWPDFGLDDAGLRRRAAELEPATAAGVLRAFYELYAESQGKPRWGDKSTNYVRKLKQVRETLPESSFVHLIRDGRDVALSQVRVHFGPDTVAEAATKWRDEIVKARRVGPRLGRYIELRYEDLVADPEPGLRRVCELCALGWDDRMLTYRERAEGRIAEIARDLERPTGEVVTAEARARHQSNVSQPLQADRAGGWREAMSPDDRRIFEGIAGDVLSELGYGAGS
jgi:Sulfotransferase family